MKKRSCIYFFERNLFIVDNSVPSMVRRCIIGAGGLVGLQPTEKDMPYSHELKRNYHFTNKHYDSLFSRLSRLVRALNPGAVVYSAEVKKCEKVSDCIKLVQDKIKVMV